MTLTNPSTGLLSADTVRQLHRLLGGDNKVEGLVLDFIRLKYGARGLFYIPAQIAENILARPNDFLTAVKKFDGGNCPF